MSSHKIKIKEGVGGGGGKYIFVSFFFKGEGSYDMIKKRVPPLLSYSK